MKSVTVGIRVFVVEGGSFMDFDEEKEKEEGGGGGGEKKPSLPVSRVLFCLF